MRANLLISIAGLLAASAALGAPPSGSASPGLSLRAQVTATTALNGLPPSYAFKFMTPAQIADVVNNTCALDLAPVIRTLISAGIRLPAGCWAIRSTVAVPGGSDTAGFILPPDKDVTVQGEGDATVVRAFVPMTYMFWKAGTDAGGTKAAVYLRDFNANANRQAGWIARIGASKGGGIINVRARSFLTGCYKVGDDTSTTPMYYENENVHDLCDGDINYAGSISTMPTYGVLGTINATDNNWSHFVPSYMVESGFDVAGGGNKYWDAHCYGSDTYGTGPKFCIKAPTRTHIEGLYADNLTVAGVDITGQQVSLVGSDWFWSLTNTPKFANITGSQDGTTLTVATSDGALPSIVSNSVVIGTPSGGEYIVSQLTSTESGGALGGKGTYQVSASQTFASRTMTATGAVPVQIESGIDTFSIVGGTSRGGNAGNPTLRWMGTARPQRGTLMGVSPTYRMSGDAGLNTFEQSLGISRSPGRDSFMTIDAPTSYKAYSQLRVNNVIGFQTTWDATALTDAVYDSAGTAFPIRTTSGATNWQSLLRVQKVQIAGNAPTAGSCGTGASVTAGSTNMAGEVAEGSSATGCTVTFATTAGQNFASAPFCTVTSQAGLAFSYAVTATTLTITNSGGLSGTKLNYACQDHQ